MFRTLVHRFGVGKMLYLLASQVYTHVKTNIRTRLHARSNRAGARAWTQGYFHLDSRLLSVVLIVDKQLLVYSISRC